METPAPFDPKKFKGKKACVLGLGKSGLAVSRLLLKKGFEVFGSDSRPRAELQGALGRMGRRFSWEGGGHGRRALSCGFAVKSPGLAPDLPVLARLREKGVPVFSELEVALCFCKSKDIVAVTGTNGKTTTTALLGEILKLDARRRRRRAWICGNIGHPVSEAAPAARRGDILVIEASSYQLEDSRHFRPRAAALLNITADHVDHHGGMARYIEAKARVFREQAGEDLCVFNASDPLVFKLSRRCAARRLYFGRKGGPVNAWTEKGELRVKIPGRKELSLSPPGLPGEHNLENAMAAALLALGLGVKASLVQKAFKAFRGVEHRLEESGTFRGIRCVNDSKATNVDSTLVALKALRGQAQGRILLILGGLHKGSPYAPLRALVEEGVKGILTIGSASRKIEEDLGGLKPIFPCGDLATAVETAFKIGAKGDLLLLSPACASFDQFKDFEERGRRFKELARSQA